jgi:4-aminobutyrate aminotransferase
MNDPRGLTITTTAGNPISTAAGRAVLATILGENLMANAAARGAELLEGLRQLANKHPLIGDVRGRGLVIGVELVHDRQSRLPATKACAKVAYRARELGVAVFYVGQRSNVIELTPPITLSKAEGQEGLEVLGQAIGDVENDRVSDEALAGYSGW